MKNNILVLSAGRRVELIQAFQHSLKTLIPAGRVFTTDMNPRRAAACQVADEAFQVPRATDAKYIDKLYGLCLENEVGLVVPTIDTELMYLSLARERFLKAGIQIVISDSELIAACRDKRATTTLYESIGVKSPEIFDKDKIKFPCFCKPYDGSRSIGAQPIYSPEMLTDEILNNERNIFMELVGPKFDEYTIDIYYDKHGTLKCLVPRERIEVRDGEVSKGATRKNFVYERLIESFKKLPGAIGCITAQVFVNAETEEIRALEINPRFGGGFPLSHAAGANYTEWLVREYLLGEQNDFFEDWESNLVMLRYDAKVLVRE